MARVLWKFGRVAAVLLPFLLAACQTLIKPPVACDEGTCPPSVFGPKVLIKPTVHAAACDLDHVEKHLDWHGSVVAKVPDVWGQARLTLYREQFEEEMVKSLDDFRESLQGSVARSDQAFAISSTALGLALNGTPATTRFGAGRYGVRDANTGQITSSELKQPVQQVVNVPSAVPVGMVPGTVDGKPALVQSTDINAFFTQPQLGFNAERFHAGLTTGAGKDDKLVLSLEPERVLEQKKRYLDLLAQIRRTNEGDDTADSPGYSLQLFRIPVSVLPGKHTDTGHGAEITMSLTPVLGEDLLPTTFRALLTNDLLNQLGFPLTQLLGDGEKEISNLLNADFQTFERVVTQLNDYLSTGNKLAAIRYAQAINKDPNLRCQFLMYAKSEPEMVEAYQELVEALVDDPKKAYVADKNVKSLSDPRRVRQSLHNTFLKNAPTKFPTAFNVPTIGFAKGLDNRTAFPTSQLIDVYGPHAVFEIAFGTYKGLGKSFQRQKYAHLPDIQAHLKEEVAAAYEFLRKNPSLLSHHCEPALVQAIRSKRLDEVLQRRQAYRSEVAGLTGSMPTEDELKETTYEPKEPYQMSVTAALGWCLIVDAALLTDRLMQDMRQAATARGRSLTSADTWLPYFLPDPPQEARCAFNEYVAMRWPIHVFALDPAIQEQNLADRLATRREMQLALSMSFASGKMNFNQLNRYARRLEAEYETIDLNRTQVGFAHGNDTFGWRFYPRYQSPDTPGNLTVLARDLLVGGPNKNQLLRERRLEPGPRECVALVIMPSFVPAVRLDTTANFFGLANPKHKVFDHTQAVELGKTVQSIKNASCGGLTDAHCYRDGDAARLMKRMEQLEARLPLQTVVFPTPIEGALGGFEMFGTSTTDLSPELYGFYGAPGADTKKVTSLFLVGDHFSPLRTRVIVGNKAVAKDTSGAKLTMISRQVMQVDFGPDMIPLNATHVTVHVATPYGVSRELLVPVVNTTASQPDGYYLTSESGVAFEYKVIDKDMKLTAAFTAVASSKIEVLGTFATGSLPPKAKLTLLVGSDSVTSDVLEVDQFGRYAVPADKLKSLLEALIVKRFPAATPYDSMRQIEERLPQIIDVKIQPEGPGGVLTPVRGILRLNFNAGVMKKP